MNSLSIRAGIGGPTIAFYLVLFSFVARSNSAKTLRYSLESDIGGIVTSETIISFPLVSAVAGALTVGHRNQSARLWSGTKLSPTNRSGGNKCCQYL